MPNDEVNEHGRFWLAGTPIDEGRRFPAGVVDGTLTIDGNGMIRLRCPITPNNPNRLVINNKNDVIVGYLPQSDRFVYLTQIDFFHPLPPISARFCLIGNASLSCMPKIDDETDIVISLDGFENWLGLPFPRYEDREDGTGALISMETQNHNYELSSVNYSIKIETDWKVEWPLVGKGTMTASGTILLKPRSAKTLLELADTVLKLEEFLLLLTNQHRSLAWPRIERQENEFIFYHHSQSNRGRSEIDTFDCWIPFPSIAVQFGYILNKWLDQNENLTLSCGFYMATRRASALYLEHQFASLVWALEAMSRNESEVPEDHKLSEKIARILDQAREKPCLKSSDRRWLENILDRAKEPPLKDRLFHLLKSLPLDLGKCELKKFTNSCADRRNELSHFAGLKQDKSATRTHNDFIQDLVKLTPALDLLCHAKILQTIGVPNDLIRNAFLSRSENRHHMREAGLPLPDPPAPTLPSPPSGAPA